MATLKRKATHRKRHPFTVVRKPGIRVDNQTRYRTADLVKFFRAILIEAGCNVRENWYITVVYARERYHKGYVRGLAYLNSRSFIMKIPFAWDTIEDDPKKLEQFAQIAHHEIDHCLGLEHKDMCHSSQIATTAWQGCRIEKQPEAKKPTVDDRVAKREATAKKRVVELERKIKRNAKLLKKWKAKVRYYEKRAETADERKMVAMNTARARKPRPVIPRLEDGNVIIGMGSSLFDEMWCLEVDTMSDRNDPPGRGEFVDVMEAAERKGRRCVLTLNKIAKDYLVYSIDNWRGDFYGDRAPLFRAAQRVMDQIGEVEPDEKNEA